MTGPPCRMCGKPDEVICYEPDNLASAICPECCDKAEHPDGETGHQFVHQRPERDYACQYCGILKNATRHAFDD